MDLIERSESANKPDSSGNRLGYKLVIWLSCRGFVNKWSDFVDHEIGNKQDNKCNDDFWDLAHHRIQCVGNWRLAKGPDRHLQYEQHHADVGRPHENIARPARRRQRLAEPGAAEMLVNLGCRGIPSVRFTHVC